MSRYRIILIVLFLLFIVANGAYLHRVPGLLGDEASEGDNVYALLHEGKSWLTGEQTYIGPLIDFVRMPFITLFGYSVMALRVITFLASLILFWLAADVFKKLFGEPAMPWIMATTFFSPIYLLYQRLGWTITFIPFFALLILWIVLRQKRHYAVLAGFIAGIGLSNHILFFPTLVAISVAVLLGSIKNSRLWLQAWPALIGFWAGFAMQLTVLFLSPGASELKTVVTTFSQRVHDLPLLLPLLISGSSYMAAYTGHELNLLILKLVTTVIIIFAVIALAYARPRKVVWLWAGVLLIQLLIKLVIIDRYTLRYFVPSMLGVWVLAGVGASVVFKKQAGSVVLASGLLLASALLVLIPFLRTGGSTADFSLGNRTERAAAFIDTDPLVACIRGAGSVSSDDIHILNRLIYFSHGYGDISVLASVTQAQWIVRYRSNNPMNDAHRELCPNLRHWRVIDRVPTKSSVSREITAPVTNPGA